MIFFLDTSDDRSSAALALIWSVGKARRDRKLLTTHVLLTYCAESEAREEDAQACKSARAGAGVVDITFGAEAWWR